VSKSEEAIPLLVCFGVFFCLTLSILLGGYNAGRASIQREAIERGFMYHEAKTGKVVWIEKEPPHDPR
jgi:hypothetical protein